MQKKSNSISIKNLFIKFKIGKGKNKRNYLALKNFNLEVKAGEVIGIVGKNGSGKTTLLKTIAGIYKPDKGKIQVTGHPFLMDLKSVFNKEIDGISNIFLVASMNKQKEEKTKERLKSILKFADIGKFIHEPVHTYSSGMIARLSFAIGINIDYDILLIDETLAVGDAEFKEKCFNKIKEIIKNKEKIVLIASHDKTILNEFCTRQITIQ